VKIRRIPPSIISRLRKAGFTTLESIAVAPVEVVSEVLRVDEEKALEVIQVAREKFKIEFKTADIVFNERFHNVKFISTGCRGLDEVLSGGVETGAVTEFVGEFGSGKTQLCHQLAVMVQLPPEAGGLSAKAIYIDTEGTFRPERIIEIAEYRGLDPKKALKNIYYTRIQSFSEQLAILNKLTQVTDEKIKLIVVDTVTSLYRLSISGKMKYRVEDMHKLAFFAKKMLEIAREREIAVVYTNQVAETISKRIPVGGIYLEAFVDTRLILQRIRGRVKGVILQWLNRVPQRKFTKFEISERGVLDVY